MLLEAKQHRERYHIPDFTDCNTVSKVKLMYSEVKLKEAQSNLYVKG